MKRAPHILTVFLAFWAIQPCCSAQDFNAINLGHCQPSLLNEKGFAELKKIIGDKRIVVIGEQEHSVGTGYENFANLVRFLHEEMGFTIIAQEYCFYSFGEINKRFQKGSSAQEYRKAMYWPQGDAIEMNALLDYLDEQRGKKSTLHMEGFDSRASYVRLYFGHLDSLLKTAPIAFTKTPAFGPYLAVMRKALANEYRDSISDQGAQEFLQQTDTIIHQLQAANVASRDVQLFRNLKGFVKNSWNIHHIDGEAFPLIRYHEREKQMFDNLVWLLEEAYPNEKFIVLMHNAHAAKNLTELVGRIPDGISKDAITIGDLLYKKYGSQVLNMATTHYRGNYGQGGYTSIPLPHPASLETQLHNKGYEYAYVDMRPYSESELYMYHFNFNEWVDSSLIKARFGKIYDGVIFIHDAKAATPLQRATDSKDWLLAQKLPPWSLDRFMQLSLDTTFSINDNINPYYIEGDFNGDKTLDIAVSVMHKTTGKKGFIILHGGSREYYVVGAGTAVGRGGDNFRWLDVWKVYRKGAVKMGWGETKPLKLKGDAIFIESYPAANALIYWSGKEYKWYHQDGF